MKIVANDYEEKDIMKIIRQWTELTQKEFGKSINLSKMTIQSYEIGQRRFSFETLLRIAHKHNLKITIEKIK